MAVPVRDTGCEVAPDPLGHGPGLVHHLQGQAVPAGEGLIIKIRGAARDHDLAVLSSLLSRASRCDVVLIGVLMAVATIGLAPFMQVRGIAIDQFGSREGEVVEIAMGTSMHQFHRPGAKTSEGCDVRRSLRSRPGIEVDADVPESRGLASTAS